MCKHIERQRQEEIKIIGLGHHHHKPWRMTLTIFQLFLLILSSLIPNILLILHFYCDIVGFLLSFFASHLSINRVVSDKLTEITLYFEFFSLVVQYDTILNGRTNLNIFSFDFGMIERKKFKMTVQYMRIFTHCFINNCKQMPMAFRIPCEWYI